MTDSADSRARDARDVGEQDVDGQDPREQDLPAQDHGDEPTNTEAVNDSGVEPDPADPDAPVASGSAGAGRGAGQPTNADSAAPAAAESDLAAERLVDLQRVQAEYVNYKRRVDRDRVVVQERAVHSVLDALLPVLDDIHAAREHGDLGGGPFERIADKLENSLGRFGLERFGERGETFDPVHHEALMHTEWPSDGSLPDDATGTTVVQVLQPGYRSGEQVLRPARVSVADPA